jgi:hypothetical protein
MPAVLTPTVTQYRALSAEDGLGMCRIMGAVTSLTAGAGDHFFAGTAHSVRRAPPPSPTAPPAAR